MRVLGVLFVAFVLIAPAPGFAADGAALYAKNCASCHGADGQADTPAAKAMKTPGVAGYEAAATVEFVKSSAKHKTPAGKLSDEELQAVATYVAGQ